MAKSSRNRLEMMTMSSVIELGDSQLEKLYVWIDDIPLSRPKKNLSRDFSDGVMAAEVVKYFIPKGVELHNYTPASGSRQKENNWYVLNRKVFPKLQLEIHPDVIRAVSQCKPWVVENFLVILRDKIDTYLAEKHGIDPMDVGMVSDLTMDDDQPEADQSTHKAFIPVEDYYVPSTGSTSRRTPHQQTYEPDKLSTMAKPKNTRGALPKKSPRVQTEMVPRHLLVQKQDQLTERHETIEILQSKIQRLEHLLHLKDIRIEDLTGRVEELESQYTRPIARDSNSYRVQHRATKPGHPGRPGRAGQSTY